jgi:hypothetical protein
LFSPAFSVEIPPHISLLFAWLGYAQSALTPILIYLLSDRVHKLINDLVTHFVDLCRNPAMMEGSENKKSTHSIEERT